MFTDNDYAIAKSLALNIILPSEYGADEDEYLNTGCISNGCRSINLMHFGIDNGITKAVVIPDNYDWVLKLPLHGMLREYCDYDEEGHEEYGTCFEQFYGADAPDGSDYCWDELLRIQEATQAGFGVLFPVTEFLCEEDGERYYIQEKVHPADSGFNSPSSLESIERAQALDAQFKYCSSEWRAAVIEHYGEDFWVSFVEWDNIQSAHILTDMHRGNYGYREDGTPVILDASGFDDC